MTFLSIQSGEGMLSAVGIQHGIIGVKGLLMSALPKVIEGTWDDVLRHSSELAGHRLRVTVLDEHPLHDHPAFDTSPAAVEAWVARLRKWAAERPPIGPLDDSRDSIYADRLDAQL
jgi:hypothetical protein